MITWLFDNRNQHSFLPNLITDKTLEPGTDAWYDLCINPPYSYEFRFLKYCILDKVPFKCALTTTDSYESPAYYPVNLNFFDTNIDYFSLMKPSSLEALQKGKFKFLFYYSEGDNVLSSGIDEHIQRLIKKHNLSRENVVCIIANALADKHPYIYFPDDELYYRMLHLRSKDWIQEVSLNPRPFNITYLNRADKIWRRVLASVLYDLGCLRNAQFSYTGYKYETSSIEEDDIKNWHLFRNNLLEAISAFSLNIPYTCDDLSISEHNNHKYIHKPHFTDSYWQLIAETHFAQDTVFLTEKTFKCILNLQPFVIAGSPNSIKLLKTLGYRTFSKVIREAYDDEQDPQERMQEIVNCVYSLSQRNDLEHIEILKIIKADLEYNQKLFLSPKVQRIQNLLTRLDYT